MKFSFKTLFLLLLLCQSQFSHAQNAAPVYSNDKEANAYYLKALHYIEIGTPRSGGSPDSLKFAVQLLNKAVKRDTLFARAFIELSRTYWRFDFSYPNYQHYFASALAVLPDSKKAILRALQIDSTSADAYSVLEGINLNYEYDWNAALKNLAKAIKYNPKNFGNYALYGQILVLKGKWKEAQKWIDTAYQLAPTDSRVLLTNGIYYYWKRDYKTAGDYFNQIHPQTFISKFFQGLNDIAGNNPAKAVEILKTLYADFEKADGGSKALLAYALIKNNKLDEGKRLVQRSYELNQVVAYRAAVFYIGLKNYKKAIELLEQGYKERSNWMIWLKYDPVLDPIRKEKRFTALLDKMKFG